MRLIFNEKKSLCSALSKVEEMTAKLGFDQIESDAAKNAVENFHSLLTSPHGEHINSKFEKVVKGANGKTLKIKGVSSSQQSLISRLVSI